MNMSLKQGTGRVGGGCYNRRMHANLNYQLFSLRYIELEGLERRKYVEKICVSYFIVFLHEAFVF